MPLTRTQVDLLEELARPLKASAAEPPKELLRPVADKEEPNHDACQKTKQTHFDSFPRSTRGNTAHGQERGPRVDRVQGEASPPLPSRAEAQLDFSV